MTYRSKSKSRLVSNCRILLIAAAVTAAMSIQLYEDKSKDAENSGAMVLLPNGLQITEEEHEKRHREVSFS